MYQTYTDTQMNRSVRRFMDHDALALWALAVVVLASVMALPALV